MIPCDFIAPAISHHPIGDHHRILLSNFFAQTEALMKGKEPQEVLEELRRSGMKEEEIKGILPYRVFRGNRPTNSILLKKVTEAVQQAGLADSSNVFLTPSNWKYLIFGLPLVLMMRFRPQGIFPAKGAR